MSLDPPHLHPTAKVDGGTVGGAASEGLQIFKGIPFATPPIGENRWKPPQPVTPWDGIRLATRFGPASLQTETPADAFYTVEQPEMDEDCLFLNIWAPDDADRLPVMVWVHGGALGWGAGSDLWYDGGQLARRGVVLITFNYRLGIFGYFSHPELSAESEHASSGNYGTLDQIAALSWVRRNIAAFGGDPANVTVFGESAGALSVTHLMASPLASGLFQRAIAQSAYLPAMPELRRARFGFPAAEVSGEAFGCRHGLRDLAALRAMPADALTDASADSYGGMGGAHAVVDGWVLQHQIFETFERGEQTAVPLIAGYNSGEILAQDPAVLPLLPETEAAFESHVRQAYGHAADRFLALYPAASPRSSAYASIGDAFYGWATEKLLRLQSILTNQTWMYHFDHVYASAAARHLGAFHASDISFTFGNIGADAKVPSNWPAPAQESIDFRMSETMMDRFVAFARDGAPGPAWPLYDAAASRHVVFSDGDAEAANGFLPDMFALHDEHIKRLRRDDASWNWGNVGIAALPLR